MATEVKPLKCVIIGCGRISKKHLEVFKELPDTQLTAVCDTNFGRAQKVAQELQIEAYEDYHQMMQKERPNLVSVLTDSGSHAAVVIDIAKYGAHIVVEKPMALTLQDADKMIWACDEHQVKLFVVKQNRYNLPVQKLKEALDQGRFGKLVMGTVRVRWCRTQAYYDQDKWRGTWEHDGGVFANQASHHVDLLEWLMGDVDTVYAKTATQLVDIETEDTGVAILKFHNGALGVIEATTATRPKDLEGSISILGEKGSVEIGGFAVNEMKIWNFTEPHEGDRDVLENYRENPPSVYGFGHYEYMKNVVECIRTGKKALVDGLEGRRSLELINAIYESAETAREVPLRFTPKKCRLGRSRQS